MGGRDVKGIFLAAAIALSAAGCAVPMNVDDFKKSTVGSSVGKSERIDVDLPFDRVIANLKGPVDACMNFAGGGIYSSHGTVAPGKIARTQMTLSQGGHAKIVTQYTPTGVINVGPQPEGGYFMFVADVSSISKSKTSIDMFYHEMIFKNEFAQKFRGWASGADKTCPW
jgi:hypothetical protein